LTRGRLGAGGWAGRGEVSDVHSAGVSIRVADYSLCESDDDGAIIKLDVTAKGFTLTCNKCDRPAHITIYKDLDVVDERFTPLHLLVGCGWCDDESVELSAPAPATVSEKEGES